MPDENQRIVDITLDEHSVVRRSPDVEHERAVAIYDLLDENYFAPKGGQHGPFTLNLSAEENRLVFDVRDKAGVGIERFAVPLVPFRRIVKDYFTVCESYYAAIKTAPPSQIEAIDMGRRALHNEGSELLRERLEEKVETDFPTARRLFTLLCVLHLKG